MLEVQIYKKLAEFDLDASFQVDDNILGLMGASGSGKSMTLKCIAGIETPDCGRIVLNGRVLFDSEKKINVPIQKRNVGYMFQSYALFPNMSVYENVCVGLKARKVKDVDGVVKKVMQQFRISELASRYPKQLSGGQRQRLALARALLRESDAYIFDEATNNVDRESEEIILKIMKRLAKDKIVIFITHRMAHCKESQLTFVMKEGRLIQQGSYEELFKQDNLFRELVENQKNLERIIENER